MWHTAITNAGVRNLTSVFYHWIGVLQRSQRADVQRAFNESIQQRDRQIGELSNQKIPELKASHRREEREARQSAALSQLRGCLHRMRFDSKVSRMRMCLHRWRNTWRVHEKSAVIALGDTKELLRQENAKRQNKMHQTGIIGLLRAFHLQRCCALHMAMRQWREATLWRCVGLEMEELRGEHAQALARLEAENEHLNRIAQEMGFKNSELRAQCEELSALRSELQLANQSGGQLKKLVRSTEQEFALDKLRLVLGSKIARTREAWRKMASCWTSHLCTRLREQEAAMERKNGELEELIRVVVESAKSEISVASTQLEASISDGAGLQMALMNREEKWLTEKLGLQTTLNERNDDVESLESEVELLRTVVQQMEVSAGIVQTEFIRLRRAAAQNLFKIIVNRLRCREIAPFIRFWAMNLTDQKHLLTMKRVHGDHKRSEQALNQAIQSIKNEYASRIAEAQRPLRHVPDIATTWQIQQSYDYGRYSPSYSSMSDVEDFTVDALVGDVSPTPGSPGSPGAPFSSQLSELDGMMASLLGSKFGLDDEVTSP